MTKYYSLLVKEDGKWSIQFGDYDKSVVKEELRNMKYLSKLHGDKQSMVIICTEDDQASIEKAVDELNGKGM